MSTAVRYYTKSGNTEKLAKAIAEEAGCEALDLSSPVPPGTDVLFFGASVYAFSLDEKVKSYIEGIDAGDAALVVPFSTSALVGSQYKKIKKLFAARGIKAAPEGFHCRGEFNGTNKGRPNEEDLVNAREFAKKFL